VIDDHDEANDDVEVVDARPLVFVTVGTDHHPFDRLLRWAATWAGDNDDVARVFAQCGTSVAPDELDCQASLPAIGLQQSLRAATVVVCHGGPATILEARHAGKLPVVVPRRAELGEHVDDHQVRFATWMAERGQVTLATTEADLHAALDKALTDPASFAVADETARRAERSALFGDLVDTLLRPR
jgi:UDP-N-acetylglucosamine transferase subunit ALG13